MTAIVYSSKEEKIDARRKMLETKQARLEEMKKALSNMTW